MTEQRNNEQQNEKKTGKILIIEDESTIAELERDYLEIYGYQTEIATDGDTGLSLALKNDYDLILLDLMLPGLDGFEICREIRQSKEIPILIVTAKTDSIDKIRGLGLGADDYITKPFDPNELTARVSANLARYRRLTSMESNLESTKDHVIQTGQLKILPDAWRVFVNDKEVRLTNKEFELLLFLASNPNIVFSKDKLFDRIWGMDSLGDASTVTVHINRLREKIEESNDDIRYIETVWGAGYRFKA